MNKALALLWRERWFILVIVLALALDGEVWFNFERLFGL